METQAKLRVAFRDSLGEVNDWCAPFVSEGAEDERIEQIALKLSNAEPLRDAHIKLQTIRSLDIEEPYSYKLVERLMKIVQQTLHYLESPELQRIGREGEVSADVVALNRVYEQLQKIEETKPEEIKKPPPKMKEKSKEVTPLKNRRTTLKKMGKCLKDALYNVGDLIFDSIGSTLFGAGCALGALVEVVSEGVFMRSNHLVGALIGAVVLPTVFAVIGIILAVTVIPIVRLGSALGALVGVFYPPAWIKGEDADGHLVSKYEQSLSVTESVWKGLEAWKNRWIDWVKS